VGRQELRRVRGCHLGFQITRGPSIGHAAECRDVPFDQRELPPFPYRN
jgi:hypothetical protein